MHHDPEHIPVLAVTMGDPAGIGPEIAVKAFARKRIYEHCRPVLIGHTLTMKRAVEETRLRLRIHSSGTIDKAVFKPGTVDMLEIGNHYARTVMQGKVSAEAGDIAFQAVKLAVELAMKGKVQGIVTGPLNKESMNKAGHHFSGHTEILAHYAKTKKIAMLLADEDLRVIHVTTHVSLRQACDLIKKQRVLDTIQLMDEGLRRLGFRNPRIGVAALNPHSGDGGLFGTEDEEEIQPAIKEARRRGIDADGPVPSDSLFAMARGGKYDGCVAMYHDQGHIPFKLLGFAWDKREKAMLRIRGVNVTLGLPFIRTSVDHGTAFEIAGKGLASPDALIQAIEYAIKLVNNTNP